MSAPVIGTRPALAPGNGATVDRSHPLAQRLEFCFVPALGHVELAKGYPATIAGVPARGVVRFGVTGKTVRSPLSSWVFNNIPDAPFLNAISVLWAGRTTSATAEALVSKCNTNGGTKNPFDVLANDGNVSQRLGFIRANDTVTAGWYWLSAVVANTDYVFVITHGTLADTPQVWRNGTRLGAPTGNVPQTGAATGNSRPLYVGQRDDGVTSATHFSAVGVWSRILTIAEIEELTRDPFCFLRY